MEALGAARLVEAIDPRRAAAASVPREQIERIRGGDEPSGIGIERSRDGDARPGGWEVRAVPSGRRPHRLEVRIRGRERPGRIEVPDAVEPREELKRFLDRLGPYAQMWIRLESDEYVRYELIESVSLAAGDD